MLVWQCSITDLNRHSVEIRPLYFTMKGEGGKKGSPGPTPPLPQGEVQPLTSCACSSEQAPTHSHAGNYNHTQSVKYKTEREKLLRIRVSAEKEGMRPGIRVKRTKVHFISIKISDIKTKHENCKAE